MSDVAKITTHVADAAARLLEQYKGKPRITALLSALTSGAQALEDALFDALMLRRLAVATGAQLDAVGKLVGRSRGGLADAAYRRVLRAQVRANRSKGTPDDVLAVFLAVIGLPDCEVQIKNLDRCSFEVDMATPEIDEQSSRAPLLLDTSLGVIDPALRPVLKQLLQRATAAGVRANLYYGHGVEGIGGCGESSAYASSLVVDHAGGVSNLQIVQNAVTNAWAFGLGFNFLLDEGTSVQETVRITGPASLGVFPLAAPTAHAHAARALIAPVFAGSKKYWHSLNPQLYYDGPADGLEDAANGVQISGYFRGVLEI